MNLSRCNEQSNGCGKHRQRHDPRFQESHVVANLRTVELVSDCSLVHGSFNPFGKSAEPGLRSGQHPGK